jgi:serine/threonine protein kinase/tetratricopeptide (TPR) repeat protein
MKCPKCQSNNPDTQQFCGECGTQIIPAKESSVSHTKTLETPIKELTRGTTFAKRYEFIEELGTGGMGSVYRVFDKKIEEEVAIKLLKPEIAADKKTIDRFRNELKFARKIGHRNVCRMYELMEEEGTHYITMEYVLGEDLKSFIKRSGQLTVGKSLSMARQICDGLSEAHRLGVVHRDLKPQNIMIDKEGNARIMDFGIARSLKTKGITGKGVMIGTPEYMSPEQVEGKEVDQRSDIYSLGIILYEMLTGTIPFEGETPFSIALKHKSEVPRHPKEINPQIPDDLSRVILRCLEKNREKRYQSSGEVRSELINIEKGIPTTEKVAKKRKPLTSKEITVTFGLRRLFIPALIFVGILIIGVVIWQLLPEKEALVAPDKKMLVVLPFENLGSPDDEYFADGITEEIRVRLTTIGQLGVIGRTSSIQYKNTNKTIQEISKELRVDYVLEGTVRWQKSHEGSSRIRVASQLLNVLDGMQLWADVYEREMNDIFLVQSDIAERVVKALDITLLDTERKSLITKPTANMEAYQYYLRGNNYLSRSYSRQDMLTSVKMYEKAVELDNTFAIAYAQLSDALLNLYWFYYDRTEECLAKAKEAADKAMTLNPDLPEAHWALGMYYYHGLLDYEHALEQFGIAQKSQPNNSGILEAIGWVKRRQGKFEECLENFKKVLELDPQSFTNAVILAETYSLMRQYKDAERRFDLAISLAPNTSRAYVYKAWLYLSWMGNTEKAREVMENAPKEITHPGLVFPTWTLIDVIDGNYQNALERLSSESPEFFETQFYFIPRAQLYAQIYGLMNQSQLEKAYYDSARKILEAKILERPEDSRLYSALGIAYAGLGRKQQAIRDAKKAVELLPVSKEAYRGTFRIKDLARVYVMVGEYDAAVEQLKFLLSIPSWMSKDSLRIDPIWDTLRSHPTFKKIAEGKE